MNKWGHDHVGIATNNLEETVQFYTDILGFEVFSECVEEDGTQIKFLRKGNLKYEVFQPPQKIPEDQTRKIDHMSFISNDIEKDYSYFMKQGYKCTTEGIQSLKNVWGKGCRYFKIKGPGGEEIEFNQILGVQEEK